MQNGHVQLLDWKIEDALVGTEALEYLDNPRRADLLVVLDCHLNHNLQVLASVAKQVYASLQSSVGRHLREVLHEELWRHGMHVEEHVL